MLCTNTLHTSADGACPERRRRDWRSLPAQTIVGATTLQYAYDGEGNRVRKELAGGAETHYVRGAGGEVLAVYENGSLQFNNILAGSEVIGTYDRTYRRYFLKDHLGSIRTTVNQLGNVDGYDDYYPFGLVMPGRSSNSANPNDNYKFTGHERDDEAGLTLDYMMARNYDPILGRFLQIDPYAAKFPDYSPYNYTFNNPINMIDPTGMAACEDGSKICEWWNNLMAVVGEILAASDQVHINLSFGDDEQQGKEHTKEEQMIADAMLQDLEDHGEKVEGIHNTMRELPGGDVMIPIMEGNPGEAALNAATYLPGGIILKAGKGYKYVKKIGEKYFRFEKEVPASNISGQARAVYVKILDENGKTIKMFKDTFNSDNTFKHRRMLLPESKNYSH